MARWISLALLVICFGSCSFMSTHPLRGIVAPIGVIVFGFLTLFLFIHERVAGVARPPVTATLDPVTQQLIRQRAQAQKARSDAAEGASPAEPEA